MAVKTGILLEKLFKKASVDTTTEELKPLFEIETEIADEYATKVDKALLTVEAAKTNPDVLKVLRQNILGVADAKMDEIIKDMGLQPGDDFVAEKNTYEKLGMLSKLLMEAGKKKAEATNNQGVHEALKKQADESAAKEAQLQKQLKEISETLTNKEKEYKSVRESDLTDFEVSKILLGKDYIFPKELDSSVKVNTAYSTIKNELAKKGFKLKRNDNGQLEIVDKEGNPAYDDRHNIIDNADSFIDGVLAQNKLLKINDPGQQQSNGSGGTDNIHIPGNKSLKNAPVIGELQKQLASLPN